MRGGSKSETITENIFREFYGNGAFIEKSAIPSHYGFKYNPQIQMFDGF